MAAKRSDWLPPATTWTLTFRITFPKNRRLKEPAQPLGLAGPHWTGLDWTWEWWSAKKGSKKHHVFISRITENVAGAGSRICTLSCSSTISLALLIVWTLTLQPAGHTHWCNGPTSDFTAAELCRLKLHWWGLTCQLWTRQLFTSSVCEERKKSHACSACYISGTTLQPPRSTGFVCLAMLNGDIWQQEDKQTWVHYSWILDDQIPTRSAKRCFKTSRKQWIKRKYCCQEINFFRQINIRLNN